MSVCITGWAHTKFGKSPAEDAEALIAEVAQAALDHAQVDASEIDAIYLGAFNNGFGRQDFQAGLVGLAVPALRHTPATRLENACATGSAAIHAGMNAIRAGQARRVLVIGAEKMTAVSTPETSEILLSCCYTKEEADVQGGFAGVFADVAKHYFQRHGDQRAALARIAAKNHSNGLKNPLAHMQKDFDFEFCNTISDKNPLVADPLRRSDCSLISDGAAALVLTSEEVALADAPRAVRFRAAAQANEFMPASKRSKIRFEGSAMAFRKAYDQAGVSVDDISFAEVHDCFTIAELLVYEAMGLANEGKGAAAITEGLTHRDGRLPINVSGGLKSKGHPIGATGVSMHVMTAMQLAGDAGDMQLEAPQLGMVFNMGGLAVANYASILERAK